MKKTLTMIMALVLITLCSTTAIAQKHRHTDRDTESTTKVVDDVTTTQTDPKQDTLTLYNANGVKIEATRDEIENFKQNIEEFTHAMEQFGISMENLDPSDNSDGAGDGKLLSTLTGTLNQGHLFDYALLIPIIAVVGFFFAPVLIVGFVLLYRYKRRKQRDQVVMAAINKGAEIPEEYRSSYSARSNVGNAPVNNDAMNKGIRRIVTGIGIWILGASINVGILMGVGLFIVVLGGGEVLIHYLNNRGTGAQSEGTYRGTENNYNQQPRNKDSLQKHEGTYEKSE